ncbi:MAG: hypothetical protein ABIX01_24025 [Chitinophagaceae bacterium]
MKEDLDRRQKNYVLMRSIRDYGMGILFLGIGVCFFFSKPFFGYELFSKEDDLLRYMVLVLFTLYGGFRIWRGYVKQYFNKQD